MIMENTGFYSIDDDEMRMVINAFKVLKQVMKEHAVAMDAVHEHNWPDEEKHYKDYDVVVGLLERFDDTLNDLKEQGRIPK